MTVRKTNVSAIDVALGARLNRDTLRLMLHSRTDHSVPSQSFMDFGTVSLMFYCGAEFIYTLYQTLPHQR